MKQQNVPLFRRYFVYFGVFAANLLAFSTSVTFNWAASIIPHLKSNDTSENPLPKPPTTLESSWIVSILNVGCIVGPLLGKILIAQLGKKKATLLLGIPIAVGHLIVAFATAVWGFLLARFLMGLAVGCTFPVMASYIADVAEPKNRGLLGSSTPVFMSLGGLFVYVTGPFMSVKMFSLINLIPLILLFTIFGLLVPETPSDLLRKNAIEEARTTLALYRGKTVKEIDAEFNKLLDSIKGKDEMQEKKNVLSNLEQLKFIFGSKPLVKGVKIVGLLSVIHGFSGMAAVAPYYQTIFDESSGSLESSYSVIIIGVVTLCSTIITAQLVERLGRRILLLLGFFLLMSSLVSLATYFLLKDKGYNIAPISWLPLVTLMIYTFAYNIQGGIPWILLTDIFPPTVLDLCATVASIAMYFLAFIVSLTFPYVQEWIGTYGAFYIFGGCMALAVIFSFLYIPETKGKSVAEVQEILSK